MSRTLIKKDEGWRRKNIKRLIELEKSVKCL